MTQLPDQVRIVEVGPRDGLQNEPQTLPAETRAELVRRLAAAGLPAVEAGSFVSPKWVPQMADSDRVMALLAADPGLDAGTAFPVLTPNLRGYQDAQAAGAREVAVFAAASESFSSKNINCSIAASLERFAPVLTAARADGVRVRGYVSCVLGCPYEGPIAPAAVARVAGELYRMGCYEISLGDTIGTGNPRAAQAMVAAVAEQVPTAQLAAHFHDTYGQALANLYAVMERGVATIDAAVAGLGGCPYAQGASGNVATEEVLYLLDGLGIETGVDLAAVAAAGRWIAGELGRAPVSKVNLALAAKSG